MEKEKTKDAKSNVSKSGKVPGDSKRYKPGDREYVNGKELREELQKFKDTDHLDYTVRLCEMLKLMCERYSLRWNLIGYSYRDEMVEDAFLRCMQQIHHINLEHEKCNPFGYISKIIENSMKASIKKEKKFQLFKEKLADKIFEEMNLDENYNYQESNGNNDNY